MTDQQPPLLPEQQQQQQQLYLQRVSQFYTQVQNWLQDDFDFAQTYSEVTDNTGQYVVPVLSIFKKDLPKLEGAVADLFPRGASVFMAEGLIEIVGVFDKESVTYMLTTSVPKVMDRTGREYPLFKGIEQEGWYWIEDSRRNRAHLLDKNLCLELLGVVSGYEFEYISQ